MTATATEVRAHQVYAPQYAKTQCEDPQVRRLEQKVSQLVLRLQKEENRFCCGPNADVMGDLKTELAYTIGQRDRLYREVVALNAALAESNAQRILAQTAASDTAKNFGVGFGCAAVGAIYFGLNAAWTTVAVAVGGVTGVFVSDAVKNQAAK